ncbi:hypothetical protein CIW48_26225 [Methylobacterium sp. P1-11]|uniref:hypothetical protein n=1 Tax=Methylobacterium sp. P1-11 TaxID=2024616 RepID=UPI0011F05893|nr:hypothetical protein [Methylobacterium sp. P1-11]KAA0121006.1 hypothetical protein CIW48_26225 [Methylobacterium sp. P1-11]
MSRAAAQRQADLPVSVEAAIAALDRLLNERERQAITTGTTLSRVRAAHDAVRAAKYDVARAEGPAAIADAVVTLEAARAELMHSSAEAAPAQADLKALDVRIAPAWAAVREAAFQDLDAAEGEACRVFNEAIARARHAAARINLVRAALDGVRFDMPRVFDPTDRSVLAGQDIQLPPVEVPHAREIARLRDEIEILRGR